MIKSMVNHPSRVRYLAGVRAAALWTGVKAGAFRPGELREKRVSHTCYLSLSECHFCLSEVIGCLKNCRA